MRSFGTVGGWGSGDDYNKSELMVMGAKSFGKHALQLAGYVGGTGYGKLPPYDPFLLGGFLRGLWVSDGRAGRQSRGPGPGRL